MNVVVAFFLILIVAAVSVAQAPDLILVNGVVRTLDSKKPGAEAIAISGGRIVAVGDNRSIRALASETTQVIDAKGRLVLPGFNDAHVHLTGIGNLFSHLDLRSARDAGEVVRKIKEYVSFVPKGRWIIGAGLRVDASALDLKTLDIAAPHDPVLLYFSDPVKALVNTAALERGPVSSPNANGTVTGADLVRIRNAVPRSHSSNWEEIVVTASNYAASLGVTSVQDVHSDDLSVTLRELSAGGRLKIRVYDCVGIRERQKLVVAGIKSATGDAMVRTGCLKGNSQLDEVDPDELKQAVADADKAGLQVMLHAIGERANDNALNAFEFAASRNGKRDRRFRIEHAHKMRSSDIGRLRGASVIASMQPHLFYYGSRAEGDDYRSLLRSGASIAFGSDASITDFNPLLGIHAAVNSSPKHALTVEEAVRAYTIGSAYAEFQEREKGTIEVGKLADFVILSDNIFAIDPSRIDRTRVLTTIVGGKVVYEADTTSMAASTDASK